ncbi:MAG TPA: ABC transporter ATP-binding protein [Streptosporangiaceae bacterium]|nr:ABC transporter ATP-binding protein [Streptosporangiaceae bacterium]
MSGQAPVALRAEGLTVVTRRSDGREVALVREVNLVLHQGEALGLVGESGSGKSLTALSLMRVLPESMRQQGTIELGGLSLSALPEERMRQIRGAQMSMVFQDPLTGLNPVRTVGSVMREALRRHRRMTRRQAHEASVAALRSVGIPSPQERLRAYPHQLSGGLMQRVMIAMALLHQPAVIICDEPTTALDATIQAQILDLLQLRVASASLILITHDLGVAAQACDRILVMYSGVIVENGRTSEVLDNPRHPYTAGLLAAAPTLDPSRPGMIPIPGSQPAPLSRPPGCAFAPRCARAQARCHREEPDVTTEPSGRSYACWNPHD